MELSAAILLGEGALSVLPLWQVGWFGLCAVKSKNGLPARQALCQAVLALIQHHEISEATPSTRDFWHPQHIGCS